MTILSPSTNLAAPGLAILEAGTRLHRIHNWQRAANVFNPCHGGRTRFAPITDEQGQCVPSLHAGSTFDSVAHETLFHDIPARAKRRTLPEAVLVGRAHSELDTRRNITLATLRAPELARWDISRTALIASSPKLYQETAAWARAIHDQFPDVEGLVWTSNRCDPEDAYLFFGDRVRDVDFNVSLTRHWWSDSSFLTDVRQAARRSGISLTI